jgi:hypothetical protein
MYRNDVENLTGALRDNISQGLKTALYVCNF